MERGEREWVMGRGGERRQTGRLGEDYLREDRSRELGDRRKWPEQSQAGIPFVANFFNSTGTDLRIGTRGRHAAGALVTGINACISEQITIFFLLLYNEKNSKTFSTPGIRGVMSIIVIVG